MKMGKANVGDIIAKTFVEVWLWLLCRLMRRSRRDWRWRLGLRVLSAWLPYNNPNVYCIWHMLVTAWLTCLKIALANN